MELVGHTLPLQRLRIFYHQWTALHPDETKRMQAHVPGDNIVSMAAYRQRHGEPLPTDELAKTAAALAKIDPWSVDYNRWIGILAAIKRDFGDAGLPLAESWAQGKPGEVAREWQRIDVSKPGAHVATIFYEAKRAQ